MANPLTGDFDAVVQISVRQINGLLATLHQNGANSNTILKLLHGARARIGVKVKPPDLTAFGDWIRHYQEARRSGPRQPIHDLLVGSAPPGAAKRIAAAFKDFDFDLEIPPPLAVRGTATLQLSTIRLSVADGSTSEVTVHVDVRAHYEADQGTAPLPAPVYGEVRAVFEVHQQPVTGGKTRLLIRPSSQDQKIQFIPAPESGLSSGQASSIATQVRKFLRDGTILLPIDLPPGFPFVAFKSLGGGGSAAIALPLQLSNTPPPPGGLQTITQGFVGPNGFAFAVSQEHVKSLIDIAKIQEEIKKVRIRKLGATYRLRFTSGPTLTFHTGAIEISGKVAVETSAWWAPNGFVSFKQRVTLALDPPTQRVDLEAVGEPDVDESWFIPHDTAVNVVKTEMAKALEANAPGIRAVFSDAKTSFGGALRQFERTASATYTQVDISPDGVKIRGEITSATRISPVVEIRETNQGQSFTAFPSWIPGGGIDRFTWSWVEHPTSHPSPWSGVAKSVTESARFILEKPQGIDKISQICLRISGSRILPNGGTENVVAGTVCHLGQRELELDIPSWWEPLMVPVWAPELPESAKLRDGIVAHVGVQVDRPRKELTQNTLVFFPDGRSSTPFESLARVLDMMRRKPAPAVYLIVPSGSFNATRREFETRLAVFPAQIASRIQVIEDTEDGWARTFDVSETPSLLLINGRREFSWKATGKLEPAEVAAALDQRLIPTPRPEFRPLRLNVSAGDPAPDVYFRDDRGVEGALHRLRGQSVLITFWQAWSAPCLTELRRLQAISNGSDRGAPFILAFHGGKERKDFDDIRKEHGLSFPMVQDSEHGAARKFGVRCWPTTIAINPDGLIEHIQLGVEGAYQQRPKHEGPATKD
jgi:peroxiredoxin